MLTMPGWTEGSARYASRSAARLPVSCFIIARNEEARIGRAIDAVADWVDEVIVVDSGSTDRTEQICRRKGVRFVFNPWPGYGAQKRFGEDLCRHDWVINIDADEVVSESLKKEIIGLFASAPTGVHGFRLRVAEVLPGRDKPLPFARTYNIVRLYNRRKIRYSSSPVHDRVDAEGAPLGQLAGIVHHYSFQSISHAIEKTNRYSDLQMETFDRADVGVLKLRLLTELPVSFFRYYVLRGYFAAGVQGFVYSMVCASYRFFRIAKMLEKQRAKADPVAHPADCRMASNGIGFDD